MTLKLFVSLFINKKLFIESDFPFKVEKFNIVNFDAICGDGY